MSSQVQAVPIASSVLLVATRWTAGIGKDQFFGGLGKDHLTGGDDADTFFFSFRLETPKGAGRDVIADFSGPTRLTLSTT